MMEHLENNKRYIIDPKMYRTDYLHIGLLSIFWIIWAPLTVYFTYLAITKNELFFYFWLIFGYLGTIGIPFTLLAKNRKQVLEVAGDSLIIYGSGIFPNSEVKIEKNDSISLTLERCHDDESTEIAYSLNLLRERDKKTKRVVLAPYVKPDDKALILEGIKSFLEKHGFSFEVKNEMQITDSDKEPFCEV